MTTPSLFELEPSVASGERGSPPLTPEQRAAVERRDGPLFVHAGAGSGKTSVLVERFVRAVIEDGVAVDRILAITFTEKAAAELRARIRARLLAAGAREAAREAERAWVSTIHGFCARVLRAHALAAGLDPEFRVLDEHSAERVADQAFAAALEEFVGAGSDPRRVDLLAAYDTRRVEGAVRALYARARARGEALPRLPAVDAPGVADLASAHERLRSAARAAQGRLSSDGATGPQVETALARIERCADAGRAGATGESLDPFELRDLAVRRGNASALRCRELDELEEARSACLELCARRRAASDLELFGALLEGYARRYAALKAESSALDFDDLELRARDLLVARPALRDRLRERFAHVLVDELQDTNRLQSELFDLLAAGNLFTVGDELQAIYGFRAADVGVFVERQEAAAAIGREARLTTSFRAPRELADVLNAAFASLLGDGFAPLEAVRGDARGEPLVELIAVDRHTGRWEDVLPAAGDPFGTSLRGVPAWRAAEARLLAARVDELVAGGEFSPGEVAVLVRSWSDVERYERALAERGLATYVAGGGGLWNAREVADLRAYLAVVANPHDEEALAGVLASPLVGASLDALALLGLRARGGPGLWPLLVAAVGDEGEHRSDTGLEANDSHNAAGVGRDGDLPEPSERDVDVRAARLREALPLADRERLAGFVRRLRDERMAAPRVALGTLIERVVAATGYDRHLLSLPGGARRFGNVRKLERLAREHEAAQGRDLRGFLDALERRARSSAREGEAPLEGEGVTAVRLMTVHAAKGLEFPLVCVADLGRAEPRASQPLRADGYGRVGLRLPDPAGRSGLDALDAAALSAEVARAEEAEERRLLWVATTRARRRLVVSGALDLERDCRGGPMDWLAPALVPDLRSASRAGARAGVYTHRWSGRSAAVAWRAVISAAVEDDLPPGIRDPAGAARALPADLGRGGSPAVAGADAGAADANARVAAPDLPMIVPRRGAVASPPEPPARISYSALESYRRCGYRFHLEREQGLDVEGAWPAPGMRQHGSPPDAPPARAHTSASVGAARGAVVHALLERVDLRRAVPPTKEAIAARLDAYAARSPALVEDVSRLLAGFLASPLRLRMGRARRIRTEVPFAFPLALAARGPSGGPPSLVVEGVLDAHCEEADSDGGRVLVVDYKTDRLAPGARPEAVCEREYSTQRLVYALAALRAGAEHAEVVHVFLERPQMPVVARFRAGDAPELERRLAVMAAELVSGRRRPSSTPGVDLCRGCPGRAALCVWGPERTGARRLEAA